MSGLPGRAEVVVIGGGHAGVEAAAAAARRGCETLLVTLDPDRLGALSCNPAIGGVGKGQLVREIDALGGWMGELADGACIHFRQLNATRGAAVHSTRMQVDMDAYGRITRERLAGLPGLRIVKDEAVDLCVDAGRVTGVVLRGGTVAAQAVIVTAGTFFHGLIHIGPEHHPGGRLDDASSEALPEKLAALGFVLGRFKTGTTPRLAGSSIDFSEMTEQPGDPVFRPFSRRSPAQPLLPQRSCYLTHTTERTHNLIRSSLHLSALYSGIITGTGVRYCPSVEDKVVKFPDRDRHHVFVEPEGCCTDRFYPNGLSNSLPLPVQEELVRSVPGLSRSQIVQAGYGIEYDYLDPLQLRPTLESKRMPGLFFAGQVNGTTGYEEAAGQGLLAGINASAQVRREPPVVLDRARAYLGVLIDDLVTKGTNEPYRMFTSRVEYRLVIREDNTDERLTDLGHALGLVQEEEWAAFQERQQRLAREQERLRRTSVAPWPGLGPVFAAWGLEPPREPASLEELLRRPEWTYAQLAALDPASAKVDPEIQQRTEIRVKYEGYIRRQDAQVADFRYLENIRIPDGFVYAGLPGLSNEIVEKLTRIAPRTLGQAGRVSGVTPAAITVLMYQIQKRTAAGPAALR